MKTIPQRIFVYHSDLKIWADRSDRTVSKLNKKIRDNFNLEKEVPLTIYHLRDYLKISLEDVLKSLV